jgi:small-conductance mechanosensitive channel
MSQITRSSLQLLQIQVPYELLLKLATVGAILIATWAATVVLGRLVARAMRKFGLKATEQAKRIVTGLAWLIGVLIGLNQLGLELIVLLVILSLGGIVLVVALRDVLSNVAAHEVITTYGLFKIGDWIEVSRCFGRVVDITWMDTVLMTLNNEMVYIPNAKITKSMVTNRTSPGETRISIPLTVDDSVDLAEVERILLDIGAELKEELAADSKPEVRINDVDSSAVKLALLLKIINPAKSTLIASEVRKRVKMKLEKARKRTPH